MKKMFLSCTLIMSSFISTQIYAQNKANELLYASSVKNLQKTMPSKVTIDGKKVYNVVSNHICSIIVTMESSKKYEFSLITWPNKSSVDESGYTAFILKDTDNKPHILRTDEIKGKIFLKNMNNLIQNCRASSKKNKITNS